MSVLLTALPGAVIFAVGLALIIAHRNYRNRVWRRSCAALARLRRERELAPRAQDAPGQSTLVFINSGGWTPPSTQPQRAAPMVVDAS